MIKATGVFLCGLLFFMQPVSAEIYTWTDGSGVVHFSDKPHPGAQQIELPPAQTISTPAAPTNKGSPPEEEEKEANYQLTITQPSHESTIRNNQGYVPVSVEVTPELSDEDKLQVVVDGAPIGQPEATTIFALKNLNRGAHTITVQLLDAKGNVTATSNAITIYMQRPRVGMVPETKPAGHE